MDVEAWLNKKGIANVFSIPTLKRQGMHITYNSDDGNYVVLDRRGTAIKFHEDKEGLRIIGVKQDVAFVQTMRFNYKGFKKREVETAALAHEAGGCVEHPSEQDLEFLVSTKSLDDMPFTSTDILNAKKIFRPCRSA